MLGVQKLKRDREIQVLTLRKLGLTFQKIAEEMKISRQRVHQIWKDAKKPKDT
jgi:transcriptional regulator